MQLLASAELNVCGAPPGVSLCQEIETRNGARWRLTIHLDRLHAFLCKRIPKQREFTLQLKPGASSSFDGYYNPFTRKVAILFGSLPIHRRFRPKPTLVHQRVAHVLAHELIHACIQKKWLLIIKVIAVWALITVYFLTSLDFYTSLVMGGVPPIVNMVFYLGYFLLLFYFIPKALALPSLIERDAEKKACSWTRDPTFLDCVEAECLVAPKPTLLTENPPEI